MRVQSTSSQTTVAQHVTRLPGAPSLATSLFQGFIASAHVLYVTYPPLQQQHAMQWAHHVRPGRPTQATRPLSCFSQMDTEHVHLRGEGGGTGRRCARHSAGRHGEELEWQGAGTKCAHERMTQTRLHSDDCGPLTRSRRMRRSCGGWAQTAGCGGRQWGRPRSSRCPQTARADV